MLGTVLSCMYDMSYDKTRCRWLFTWSLKNGEIAKINFVVELEKNAALLYQHKVSSGRPL